MDELAKNKTLIDELADLDLSKVVISATIDANGNLGSVGGILQKINSEALAYEILHGTMIAFGIAHDQQGIPDYIEHSTRMSLLRGENVVGLVSSLAAAQGWRKAMKTAARECADNQLAADIRPFIDIPVDGPTAWAAFYQEEGLQIPRLVRRERAKRSAPGSWLSSLFRRQPDDEMYAGLAWEYHDLAVSWKHLFSDFARALGIGARQWPVPRMVVLAPPGTGKSILLHSLARRLVAEQLPGPGGKHWLPIRVGAADLRDKWKRLNDEGHPATLQSVSARRQLVALMIRFIPQAIWEALAVARADKSMLAQALTEIERNDWLDTQLSQGRFCLLLDGLDEAGEFSQTLLRWLSALGSPDSCEAGDQTPVIATCRDADFDGLREAARGWSVIALKGLSDVQRQAWLQAWKQHTPSAVSNDEWLKHENDLLPLVSAPLLLAMAANVADDSSPKHQVKSNVPQLYRGIVRRLLSRRRPTEESEAFSRLRTCTYRDEVIEDLALRLWFRDIQAVRFATKDVADQLDAVVAARPAIAGISHDDWLAYFLDAGLLRRSRTEEYDQLSFLHRSLHEHLAGAALARRIDSPVFKKRWDLTGVCAWTSARRWLSSVYAIPAWSDVVCHAIVLTASPEAALGLLNNDYRDPLRRGVALAARAIGEIDIPENTARSRIRDEITRRMINLNVDLFRHPYFERAWTGALSANGRIDRSRRLQDWLADSCGLTRIIDVLPRRSLHLVRRLPELLFKRAFNLTQPTPNGIPMEFIEETYRQHPLVLLDDADIWAALGGQEFIEEQMLLLISRGPHDERAYVLGHRTLPQWVQRNPQWASAVLANCDNDNNIVRERAQSHYEALQDAGRLQPPPNAIIEPRQSSITESPQQSNRGDFISLAADIVTLGPLIRRYGGRFVAAVWGDPPPSTFGEYVDMLVFGAVFGALFTMPVWLSSMGMNPDDARGAAGITIIFVTILIALFIGSDEAMVVLVLGGMLAAFSLPLIFLGGLVSTIILIAFIAEGMCNELRTCKKLIPSIKPAWAVLSPVLWVSFIALPQMGYPILGITLGVEYAIVLLSWRRWYDRLFGSSDHRSGWYVPKIVLQSPLDDCPPCVEPITKTDCT